MIEFSIVDWAAWAPGLSERSQWLGWADAPYPPVGEDTPALAEIPAMQRRRIERLGRMAIQAACWCEEGQGRTARSRLVFASRHGDVARSMELLGRCPTISPC
ncbi:3-oxoacyl-ACP synthase, partial [Stenotrophomonas maltophilia]